VISEAARRAPGRDPIDRELRVDAAGSRERILAAAAGEEFEPSVVARIQAPTTRRSAPMLVRC
jgi:hypothetical protein